MNPKPAIAKIALALIGAAFLLVGCASSSKPIATIDSEHPASPDGMEGSRPATVSLKRDAATLRTRKLIEQRAQKVEQPVTEQTSSGGQIATPGNQKSEGKEHEHHH